MADHVPDQEVIDAINSVKEAQDRVNSVVKQNAVEAFAEAGKPTQFSKVVSTVYTFESTVQWTDAYGNTQECNAVQVDVRTNNEGETTTTVVPASVYEAPPGQPGTPPSYFHNGTGAVLPSEVAAAIENS